MDKSKIKIKLGLFRLALDLIFFIISGLTLLYSIFASNNLSYLSSLTLFLLTLNLLLFIVGNVLKRRFLLSVSWILLAFLSIETYILLIPGVTYFFTFFLIMGTLIFVDVAHFFEKISPISVRRSDITEEKTEHVWSLLKKHLLFVITFSILSCLISFTVIRLSFPIPLFSNPVLGIAIFCSIAILLIAGLILKNEY